MKALIGLASLDGSAATPLAACQKVDILVNNQKSVKIKALKKEVPARTKKEVASNQSLQHIEGHRMKSHHL